MFNLLVATDVVFSDVSTDVLQFLRLGLIFILLHYYYYYVCSLRPEVSCLSIFGRNKVLQERKREKRAK